MTPLQAATHADPYAYYAALRRNDELSFDAELGLWIASSARTVEAVLTHPDCLVRPSHEPVPAAIANGAAGQVFARLMRMNEGAAHQCPRAVVEPALARLDAVHIARVVSQVSRRLHSLDEWMFTLPVAVVGSLLGVPGERLHRVAALTRDFVACLSPLSSQAHLRAADAGAVHLGQLFGAVLEQTGLLKQLLHGEWGDPNALTPNLIGLLSQTCEASAGLIGNTLVTLARRPDLLAHIQRMPALVPALVEEVARYDSPVQNTRRFAAGPCSIGNRFLEKGDTVLVLLAAANRDPDANPDPDSILLERPGRRLFSFGVGKHHCPGQALALNIASQALRELLRQPSVWADARQCGYWPSLNGRIPRFECAGLYP